MLIMYDFDGTLVDSTDAIYESFCFALDKKLNYDECASKIGLSLEDILRDFGVNEEKMDEKIAAYKNHYKEIYLQKSSLLPFAAKSISLAKQHAKIALVTTKSTLMSKNLLKHFGLLDDFCVVIGRDDVDFVKPNAQPLLKAMEIAGEQAKNCVMIGDTIYDLMAAKNAGVVGIGKVFKYQKKEELLKHSEYVFDNILDATKYAIEILSD